MARNAAANTIYSATYSNVPVYEFNIEGNHVMRRRSDDWINATHILKVADYDKPARTRILEREVQKGVHEKVQGGYGKYQGTWIPLDDGRALASKNGVLEKLMPIFSFVPGDRTPPPAPKHATAASSKPRAPRAAPQRKQPAPSKYTRAKKDDQASLTHSAVYNTVDYDQMDMSMQDPGTPGGETIESTSLFDEYDASMYSTSRKRRRIADPVSQAELEHRAWRVWAEELLDYFMLEDHADDAVAPPLPANVDLNRPIDDKGYTALHWAAAMGNIEVIKDLIRNGASIEVQSRNGDTPLMRSVVFTNSFDKRNMEKLAGLFIRTVNMQEWSGSSVFHHIAAVTQSKKKYECARYYMDCILNKMAEVLSPDHIEHVLNMTDHNGDTAITIAARNGARKCVRSLIGRNAAVDIPNAIGETADQLIVQLNHRRQERSNNRQLSSSPFQGDSTVVDSRLGGAVQPPNGIPFDPLVPHTSLNGTNSSSHDATRVYRSEAALTLTSQTMPVVFSKAKALASKIDEEIDEKNAELAEAERVAAMRRSELEQLKREQERLLQRDLEQTSGGMESDEQLEKDLAELERECEGLAEAEEGQKLKDLLNIEFNSLDGLIDDVSDHETLLREKLSLARTLVDLQQKRSLLIKEITANLSVAGLGDKQDQYKRLITGALGVREEDVEAMLPDIVNELEDWKGLEAVGA